ncbi:MAG: right-handed parallel beta-helix repeat-containing protein [Candidatus Cloacimonadota bacterium]|nr:right-handed parallel beta-helix repeat-containing protein [Candidatus Cloacimonadota bacterium]
MKNVFLSLIIIFISSLSATIINIPADQPTIQAGINVAVNTDTVLVQPGTYVENINYNGKLIAVASLFITTQDTIFISQTIIDGNQSGSVVTFENYEDSTAILCGFTITHGTHEIGGGILCHNSNPSLKYLIVAENTATYSGGGIYFSNSSSVLIEVTITNNYSYNGAGIYCSNSEIIILDLFLSSNIAEMDGGGIKFYNSDPDLENIIITDNHSDYGGGIYCDESNPNLLNSLISNNSADRDGGGIHCYNFSSPNLNNVTISYNYADYNGGGIICSNNSNPNLYNVSLANNYVNGKGGGIYSSGSNPTLENITITDNYSTGLYGYGGGIYCSYSNMNLEEVVISGNAAMKGGGIYCFLFSNPDLININIINNTATEKGGGIFCYANSNPSLENVTVTGNYANETGGGIFCLENSMLYFNEENKCNIYLNNIINNRGFGVDINAIDCDIINIIVDTFTVLTPTDYYASPIDNFTFDIISSIQDSLINSDLYVAIDGDDMNSGISADNPLQTIRCALSKIYSDSLNHNSIILLPGIYSSETNGEVFPLEWSNHVSLEGNLEEETILDANDSDGILRFNYISDASVNNVIIRNGHAYQGGGIYCYYSNPNFEYITLIDNYASIGGGIYCENSNASLSNIELINNSAYNEGGGIYCQTSSPSLEIVTIIGNTADFGGGIYLNNSHPSLVDVLVDNNIANDDGGGLICYIDSNPNLYNVIISGNSAALRGGGIVCTENSNPVFQNIEITSNSVSGINGKGGGLFCDGSNPILTNVIIIDNSAFGDGGKGGGLYCEGSNPSLVNVTFTENSAEHDAGAIRCNSNSNPTLINCILWNDLPEEIYTQSGSVIAIYSNIQGGWTGEGNIGEDPLFIGNGDFPFSLLVDSPCINTGTPDTTGLNLPEYDLAGNPRFFGGRIDMGAYENQNIVSSDDYLITNTMTLYQNYPNPFNPTTTISFSIPEESKIDLIVYNIKGQKVKTIANESFEMGNHAIIWNGDDESGEQVGSGIYLYKLNVNGKTEAVKRCLLLK